MKDDRLEHKHVLFNATFKKTPFSDESFTCNWINKVVELIGMEILIPPKACRSEAEGNEGISAFCLITTSHISLHSWEKRDPNYIQLDVYSCKNFDHLILVEELKRMGASRVGCSCHNRSIGETKGWIIGDENLL